MSDFADDLSEMLMPQVAQNIRDLEKFVGPVCESPIELHLGLAIWAVAHIIKIRHRPYFVMSETARAQLPEPGKPAPDDTIYIVPQYHFQRFRIDWAVIEGGQWVFVECDGHDFHERTKEQAARDRSRDRAIQTAGIPVLRFTGSEIHRDPTICACEVFQFLHAQRRAA